MSALIFLAGFVLILTGTGVGSEDTSQWYRALCVVAGLAAMIAAARMEKQGD